MLQMGVDDDQLQVAPHEHVNRVDAVESGALDAEFMGVHGGCIIARMLPYVDISSLFFVPINHALHRGVFRDLVLELLQPLQQLKRLHDQHAAMEASGPLARAQQLVDELQQKVRRNAVANRRND